MLPSNVSTEVVYVFLTPPPHPLPHTHITFHNSFFLFRSPYVCLIKFGKEHLVQALRLCTGRMAHRGSRGIALPFLDHGTRRGEGSASRPGRSSPPGKTQYPLYRRLAGPQGRSGQVRKISPPRGFDPRTVQPVASRYTDLATRPTLCLILGEKSKIRSSSLRL